MDGAIMDDVGSCFSYALARSLRAELGGLLVACLVAGIGGTPDGSAIAQKRPVPEGATVELVASGFKFTEGPLWYEGVLLFSDIPANTVYRWTPEQGAQVFVKPSGHANGLAVDPDGRLLLAQHDGQVARRTADGTIAPLVQAYGGKALNSPNDLTVASDGTIYFTDPPFGVDEDDRELPFSGVYRLAPDGTLHLLTTAFSRPNGICLSPNDSTLYVNDTEDRVVRAFDVTDGGDLDDGRLFASLKEAPGGSGPDGMTVDTKGHLYTTGPGGVWVFAPDGTRLARVAVPKTPTNVAFGGPDRKMLYVTARAHVYRVPVTVPGPR